MTSAVSGEISHIPYETKGQGSPIIFISGLGSNYTIWQPLSDQFSTEFTTISCNPQNLYSETIEDPDLYIKTISEGFEKLSTELNLESPVVIGHSSSAAIAAALAYNHPDKIKKIVLINPLIKVDLVRFTFLSTLEKLLQKGLNEEDAIELLTPWLFSRVFLSNSESVKNFIESSKDRFCLNAQNLKGLLSFLPKIDMGSFFSKIKTPTLILTGDQDLFVSPADQAKLADSLSNGEVIAIPSSGHMAHWEQNEYCGKIIKKFLES